MRTVEGSACAWPGFTGPVAEQELNLALGAVAMVVVGFPYAAGPWMVVCLRKCGGGAEQHECGQDGFFHDVLLESFS